MIKSQQKGFTLLEILLAVAALVILASIVILAINPGKQLADTRNAQRSADVNTIINAVYQYAIDNNGDLPPNIDNTAKVICPNGVASTTANCDIDLDVLVPTYLVGMPVDGRALTDSTGYTIATSTGNRVIVNAPLAEQGQTISVTR